jgi:hypothetical protein
MTVRDIDRVRLVASLVLSMSVTGVVAGQGPGAPTTAPAASVAAPIDVTGYWVAVVNKEWRFRMVIPAKGDFFGPIGGIPINAEARRLAEAWDPAKDEKSGDACKGFGAAGLMRVPGRLRIGWQDDNTLRVDTDAGMQTRVLHFGATPPRGRASWQGDSVARWLGLPPEGTGGGTGGRLTGPSEGTRSPVYASFEVVTTNMRPGYLRRNGVPYSAGASMTEYWNVFREPDGTDWLVIAATVVDPTYLQMPYETSPAFKREKDGSKWDPSPCSARW